jgi:hypothetical protein
MNQMADAWMSQIPGEQLADEAIALVEPEIETADSFELMRLAGTLSGVVDAFRNWDRKRALRVARWQTGGWVRGGPWNSADGKGSALAVIGLDAAKDDPSLAAQLLAECLADEDIEVHLGERNPYQSTDHLFLPAELAQPGANNTMRISKFVTYITNEVNYWLRGRELRFFGCPADVLRSLEFAFFPRASWAQAVAAAVAPVAAADLERAVAMAFWPCHPCDRLVALAALAAPLDAAGDLRGKTALRAIRAIAQALPPFVPAVDLAKVPQQPVLMYLDPTVRARFEAAVVLPSAGNELGQSMSSRPGPGTSGWCGTRSRCFAICARRRPPTWSRSQGTTTSTHS